MRLSRSEIVSKLGAEGYRFADFNYVLEGNYLPEDAKWTYTDCAHVEHIHDSVKPVFCTVDHDYHGSIQLQKILGCRFPMAHAHYMSAPDCHTYYATFVVFVVVIETEWKSIGANQTRVTTRYSVGAPRSLRWCLPLVGWLIKRNARDLQAGDIPVRERRAELRAWGYSFRKLGDRYTFEETLDISQSRVIPPRSAERAHVLSVSIAELPRDGELFLGRDDHLGVRVVRSDDRVMVFPRMCPHEGASLDRARILGKRVICPWHGRVCGPLGSLDLARSGGQQVTSEHHQMQLADGILTIAPVVKEVLSRER